MYTQYRRVSNPGGVSALIEHIQDTYNLALRSVGVGSLEITFQCTSLESLECLWSDYQSGHLNDIAERYLVTDDIKKKLNLESIRLKTIIEEENYRICKRILMGRLCESGSSLQGIYCLQFRLKQLKTEIKSKKKGLIPFAYVRPTLTGYLFCCNPDYVALCFLRHCYIFTAAILVHYVTMVSL